MSILRESCFQLWLRRIRIAMFAAMAMLVPSVTGATTVLSGIETCQPGKQTKVYVAPAPRPMRDAVSSSPNVQAKLAARRTINLAGPWLDTQRHAIENYGIVWHSWESLPAGGNPIWLKEVLWAYFHSNRNDRHYHPAAQSLDDFRTGKSWAKADEYGRAERLDYTDPGFPAYIAAVAAEMVTTTGADGVVLDWWIDDHPQVAPAKVRAARKAIARAIGERLGDGAILMGNVGRSVDRATAPLLNAVFMELWKTRPEKGYSCADLTAFEAALAFYDETLRQPKIIVFEPWRITRAATNKDRLSPANRRLAALFAAMAAVIPRNGYMNYTDNARDSKKSDHEHVLYDTYALDIGQAISDKTRISAGLAYRAFERGIVIYNISKDKAVVTFDDGQVTVNSVEGLVCAKTASGYRCN